MFKYIPPSKTEKNPKVVPGDVIACWDDVNNKPFNEAIVKNIIYGEPEVEFLNPTGYLDGENKKAIIWPFKYYYKICHTFLTD